MHFQNHTCYFNGKPSHRSFGFCTVLGVGPLLLALLTPLCSSLLAFAVAHHFRFYFNVEQDVPAEASWGTPRGSPGNSGIDRKSQMPSPECATGTGPLPPRQVLPHLASDPQLFSVTQS